MAKFKVGDVVRVRDDLTAETDLPGGFTRQMGLYRGQLVTIGGSMFSGFYNVFLDGGIWFWPESVFYDCVVTPAPEPEPDPEKPAPKYKPGDKVRVRDDLVDGKIYDHKVLFVSSMERFRGQVVTIKDVPFVDGYRIEEGLFKWSESMFYGLVEAPKPDPQFKTGDRVRLTGTINRGPDIDGEYRVIIDDANQNCPVSWIKPEGLEKVVD